MTTNAPEPHDVWSLLGDPTRRSIIERLSVAPSSVTQLAEDLPVSRPAVSQHLKVLKDAGVVRDQALGARRVYSLDAARLARYRRQLDKFWGTTLQQLEHLTDDPSSTQEAR